MEQLQLPYLVKLQVYEGPLDLLIQLIRKNEIDIYDIPIAKITEQYLEYLKILKKYDLAIVGDYLALAAQLSLIKSRMMLPSPPAEEDEEDSRDELVRRLLEYERYKEVAEELNKNDILGKDVFTRGPNYYDEFGQPAEEAEIVKTDIWSLVEAFIEISRRKDFSHTEDIVYKIEDYSIEKKTDEVLIFIKFKGKTRFKDLFMNLTSKMEFIVTFLAVLQMVKNDILNIVQEDHNSEVSLIRSEDENVAEQ